VKIIKQVGNINEKATSCLVFMFQPLAATYSQPVAVFASRGPVVGTELANVEMYNSFRAIGCYYTWICL